MLPRTSFDERFPGQEPHERMPITDQPQASQAATNNDNYDPRVVMAAERTLLAWIRTGLAFMGFGLVVSRFGCFLREFVFQLLT